MGHNTHTEVIRIGGATAILTGVPDRCQHVYEENVYILGNGDVLAEKNYMCPTNEETSRLLQLEAENRDSFIQTGTSRCIKCKKIYEPPMF